MDKDNSKIITLSFLFAAVLVYVIFNVLMETAAAAYGPIARFYAQDFARHGLPLVVAVLTFASLQFNGKIKKWADEVIKETRKVVWVTKKDVVAMTIVTCIMVIISCVILAVFDYGSTELIKLIL